MDPLTGRDWNDASDQGWLGQINKGGAGRAEFPSRRQGSSGRTVPPRPTRSIPMFQRRWRESPWQGKRETDSLSGGFHAMEDPQTNNKRQCGGWEPPPGGVYGQETHQGRGTPDNGKGGRIPHGIALNSSTSGMSTIWSHGKDNMSL